MLENLKNEIPLLVRYAKEIGKPFAILDLETTCENIKGDEFGIAELSYIAIMPDGNIVNFSTLMNPERPMTPVASKITGLTDADLIGKPTFKEVYPRIRGLLEKAVISGFNVRRFDVPGLLNLMDKHGLARPTQPIDIIDARDVWSLFKTGELAGQFTAGKLTDVAATLNRPFDGAHRAMSDVLGTAGVLDALIWEVGVSTLEKAIQGPYVPNPNDSPAPGENLTEIELDLKGRIDNFLASITNGGAKGQQAFIDDLSRHGWKVNVSSYGASFNKDGQKVQGSRLGKGYGWKGLLPRINGEEASAHEAPQNAQSTQSSSNQNNQASTQQTPSSQSNGQSGEQKPDFKKVILSSFENKGKVDAKEIMSSNGFPPKFETSISFELSNMVKNGEVPAEAAAIDVHQAWLKDNFDRISTPGDSRLKPMLEKALALGAPKGMDYVQLNVAMVLRKNNKPWLPPKSNDDQAPSGEAVSPHQSTTSVKGSFGDDSTASPTIQNSAPSSHKQNSGSSFGSDDMNHMEEHGAAGELEWMGKPIDENQEGVDYVVTGGDIHHAPPPEDDFEGFFGEEDGLPLDTSPQVSKPRF